MDQNSKNKIVSVVQAGSDPFDTDSTIEAFGDWLSAAKAAGSELVVFPEAYIGGYPKGVDFGTRVGSRTEAGRDLFRMYADNAVELESARYAAMADLVAANDMTCIVGAIEKRGSTLHCSTFGFERDGSLMGVHRKLVPTAAERLIWGRGDGGDLPIMDSTAGRLVSAICWENYMPLLRSHYYAANPDFYCVSTVDDREIWASAMRVFAWESRSFLLNACQYLERGKIHLGPDLFDSREGNDPEIVLINGGSSIISPMGEVLAGPVYGKEAVLTAEVDLDDRMRAKFDFDVAGHYARPDVFALNVDGGASDQASESNARCRSQ